MFLVFKFNFRIKKVQVGHISLPSHGKVINEPLVAYKFVWMINKLATLRANLAPIATPLVLKKVLFVVPELIYRQTTDSLEEEKAHCTDVIASSWPIMVYKSLEQ